MEKDCEHDIENAKYVSRATWVCPICGEDISYLYVLWMSFVHPASDGG